MTAGAAGGRAGAEGSGVSSVGPGSGDAPASPDGSVVLDVRDLAVEFPTFDGAVRAVRGVTLTVHTAGVVAVVGESGSGKSVTALAIMGLLPRTARVTGSVRYRGAELLGLPERRMAKLRGKEIAMIFQDPMTSLNPVHRIGVQLAEAIRVHTDVTRGVARRRAVGLLERVGVPDAPARARSYPHELSGGMRQRVVIAMAMANDPAVMLADEPTTALDVTIQAQILETIATAREATGAAMILITHDLGVVAGVADQVVVMYAGRAVEVGTAADIFYRPRMPYTVGLLGAMPRVDQSDGGRLVPVEGAPPSMIDLPRGCPFNPRCPLAAGVCFETEPALVAVAPDHLSACHRVGEVPALAVERLGARLGPEPTPNSVVPPSR